MNQPKHGGNLAWAAILAGCPPSSILDFSASISPLGPPPSVNAAIHSHLSELRNYPDPSYYSLRSQLGQACSLAPEWILPGNGAAELLTWAGWELSTLPTTFLLTPAFGDYRRCLQTFGATVVDCPLLGDEEGEFLGVDEATAQAPSGLDCLIPKLQQQKAPGGLLLNNPHNPTGKLFSKAAILPYLEHFALVVVDEAFMDFLPPGDEESLVTVVQDYPNLVILRSLTKFYSMPGLRLGYAIAHPDRLQRWQQWRDPWPVNILAAAAGEAVVQDTAFQEQTWTWLPPARSQLFDGLAGIPGLQPLPSSANFLLVRSHHSCSQLQQDLLTRHRILIRDCLSFPELGDRYFRVAVRLPEENQRLIAALTDILS